MFHQEKIQIGNLLSVVSIIIIKAVTALTKFSLTKF